MEFPQTVFEFFGILVSKPPHQIWDLDHFPMLQKSTLPLSEESVLGSSNMHVACHSVLKHPLRCWSLVVAPHILCWCPLYCCPWHCLICTATPSESWSYPFLLLKWILDHHHLFSEIDKLGLPQSLREYICHLFSCWSVLQLYNSSLDIVSDEVTPNVNVWISEDVLC